MSLPASERKKTNLPPIRFLESPNQSKRVHGDKAVDLIVCHTPEGPYDAMVSFLRGSSSGVSYHSLTKEDGSEVTQLVPWSRKAWHAGVQNSRSEGHALAGRAATTKAFSPGGRKFARLIAYRLHKRGFKPVWRRKGEVGGGFCRHADLQKDRSDPMNLTQWLLFVAMVKYQYHAGGFRTSPYGRS